MLDDGKGKYLALARRWRPKRFCDVVGQEHIISTLTNAINYGRVAHAYLFVGPRGTGKTTTARLFASALNAENGPTTDFDPSTTVSLEIANGSCLDVVEIDGASNNSVEQVRSLREECRYAPTACQYKIYIIDEVHMLTNAAFNALLKTLEEPPNHVKFIFATTEAHKVLPTIVSRCQKLSFRPVPVDVLSTKLEEISNAEGIKISQDAIDRIARLSNGGVRDAETILERMISYCNGDEITEEHVNSAYGLTDTNTVKSIINAMYYGDYKKLLNIANTVERSNCDIYSVMVDIETMLHEQLTAEVSGEIYPDRMIRILEVIHDAKESVKSGISEEINFEAALLKAAEHGQSRAIDAILRDIREIKSSGQCKIDGSEKEQCTYSKSRLPASVQSILSEGFHAKLSTLKDRE